MKYKKFYSWKFKDEELTKKPTELHFISLPFDNEKSFNIMSNISEIIGILGGGSPERKEMLNKIIGTFINWGIFLKDNELIELNRKKPIEEEKEDKKSYLG
jgi:hypothetical protein